MATLLKQTNVISLRTATVTDDGNLVELRLEPADSNALMPAEKRHWAPKDFDWVYKDFAWLFRHMRSESEEEKLRSEDRMEQAITPLVFAKPPKMRLMWTDNGNSVALYLNEQPWAFIFESDHKGYSKGVLGAHTCNGWNQELFERVFEQS
jgi:hypothetical protein